MECELEQPTLFADLETEKEATTLDLADERRLLERCQEGNDAAFDELVARTKRAIFALAYRWTQDREAAFDIVQETYIKLHGFLPRWDFSCRVRTWLYRVATNACIDRRRRQHLTLVSVDEPGDNGDGYKRYASDAPSPAESLEALERREIFERCMATLPEKMQATFRLKYIGGLTLRQIAEVQGNSLGTIKSTLHRAAQLIAIAATTMDRRHNRGG